MDATGDGLGSTADRIVTVVVVDVEGSTALVDRLGDHVGTDAVVRRLDQVRDHLSSYGGREVNSLGDGLLVVFSSPRQAVACALGVQRALSGSAPRLRIGVNAGEVVDPDGDPTGAAVNAAARIVARAEGGEVLVSDVVRQLVGRVPTVRFVDRGRVRLKGFEDRWRLWAAHDTASVTSRRVTIGRSDEQELLRGLVESAVVGIGSAIVVEGEPGIGKSHLLADVIDVAGEVGAVVVHATADDVMRRHGALPHALIRQPRLPAGVAAELRDALGGPLRPGDSADLSFAVIESSVDAVEALSRHAPVLVAFDDAQWADDLSVGVLRALVARASTGRFAVVATCRPAPRSAAIDRLISEIVDGAGHRVCLHALGEVDVHALSTVLTGGAPGRLLRARLTATGGNPLFAIELLRSLDEEGQVRVDGGIAEVADTGTPAGLSETLVRRLSWLPVETRDLLRLASLLGTSFTLGELASITHRSVIEIAASLRDAMLSGLIVGEADRLAFRHDLVREAIYEHMLPAERRDLHRATALALRAAGAPVQQVAEQFGLGALPGDLDAVGWLRRAADEVLAFTPAAAVDLYYRALALAPERWPERGALLATLIEPLARCGRFDEAERLANEVIASNPSDDVTFQACRGMAAVYGSRGDLARSTAMLEQAISTPGAPEPESARMHCMAAQLSVFAGLVDPRDGQRRAEAGLARGLEVGDAELQCTAHQALGCIDSLSGHGQDALNHFVQATALFDSGRVSPNAFLVPDLFAAAELTEHDRLDEAIALSATARERYVRRGALSQLPLSFGVTAAALYLGGRYDDAMAELESGLAVSLDLGNRSFLLYLHGLKARIAVRRGDADGARGELASGFECMAANPSLYGVGGHATLIDAKILLQDATGEFDAALSLADTLWQQTDRVRHFFGVRERAVPIVQLALRGDRRDLATEVTEAMETGAQWRPCPSARAVAQQCRGLLELDSDLLLAAVAELRQTPLRPALARSLVDAATVLGDRDRGAAIALLDEASSIHADLGEIVDLARVDAALATFGGPSHLPRPQRPTFGWESLTPTELSVSRLAAEGLTNPEIGARLYISRRTVESHLAHTYRKLGISGRAQLAAEVTRRG